MKSILKILFTLLFIPTVQAAVGPCVWLAGKFDNQSSFQLLRSQPTTNNSGGGIRFSMDDDVYAALNNNNTFLLKSIPEHTTKFSIVYDNTATHIATAQCIFTVSIDKNLHAKVNLIQDGQYIHCQYQGDINNNTAQITITDPV